MRREEWIADDSPDGADRPVGAVGLRNIDQMVGIESTILGRALWSLRHRARADVPITPQSLGQSHRPQALVSLPSPFVVLIGGRAAE